VLDCILLSCCGIFPRSLTYLEALLASLNGGDISSNTATDDNEILLLCANVSMLVGAPDNTDKKLIPVSVA
jgi:hypothetical protein